MSQRTADATRDSQPGSSATSRPDTGKAAPLSSAAWCEHFGHNAVSQKYIPWNDGARLSPEERRSVADSVRAFQLGESGQGRHFLRAAERYAARSGDWTYLRALRLFIAEENRHAAYLGRFLDSAGIRRARRDWSNGVFRWLRQRAGLDLMISVLVAAEIIARVYYAALRKATRSVVLRRICEQVLRDETAHIRFQCERLAILRRGRSRIALVGLRWWQRCVFFGARGVMLWAHWRVFRAAGMGVRRFWRRAGAELRVALDIMDPRRYDFSDGAIGSSDPLTSPRAAKAPNSKRVAASFPIPREEHAPEDGGVDRQQNAAHRTVGHRAAERAAAELS